MTADALRERIGGEWSEHRDGWWITVEPARVREVAVSCLDAGARLSALLSLPGPDGALLLSWHWDLRGILLSVRASFGPREEVPSIADLHPAADWAEREAHDYYAVAFAGRAATPPLMLREGDAPGVMLPPKP